MQKQTASSIDEFVVFVHVAWSRQSHWRFRHALGVVSQTGKFQAQLGAAGA